MPPQAVGMWCELWVWLWEALKEGRGMEIPRRDSVGDPLVLCLWLCVFVVLSLSLILSFLYFCQQKESERRGKVKERIFFWLKRIERSSKCEIKRQKSAPLTYIKICLKTDPESTTWTHTHTHTHTHTRTHTHMQMRPKPRPRTDTHSSRSIYLSIYLFLYIGGFKTNTTIRSNYCYDKKC